MNYLCQSQDSTDDATYCLWAMAMDQDKNALHPAKSTDHHYFEIYIARAICGSKLVSFSFHF